MIQDIALKLLKHLMDDLLIHECREVSPFTASLVSLIDKEERYSHVEIVDGKHYLWHKHLYRSSELRRQRIREGMLAIREQAERREQIRAEVIVQITRLVPDDKKFVKLIDAMVNKIMAGKACELAKTLGIDQSEIPQINYWKL